MNQIICHLALVVTIYFNKIEHIDVSCNCLYHYIILMVVSLTILIRLCTREKKNYDGKINFFFSMCGKTTQKSM